MRKYAKPIVFGISVQIQEPKRVGGMGKTGKMHLRSTFLYPTGYAGKDAAVLSLS
jgi:hypothetical protein